MIKSKINKVICKIIFFIFSLTQSSFFKILFSRKDDITAVILEEIDNAKKEILVASYMFTDRKIADALIQAKNRGIKVKIILDPISVHSPWGKVKHLEKNQVDILVYDNSQIQKDTSKTDEENEIISDLSITEPTYKPGRGIMHHKFMIVDSRLVLTGSFNLTWSANWINRENVITLKSFEDIELFTQEFVELEKSCLKIEDYRKKKLLASTKKIAYKKQLRNPLKKIIHKGINWIDKLFQDFSGYNFFKA